MARKRIDYNSFLLASSKLRFVQSDDGYKVFYGLKKKSQPWLGGAAILISLWFLYSSITPGISSPKTLLQFFVFLFLGIYLCAGRKELLAINNETLTSRLGLQKRTVPINAVKLLYCEKVRRGKGERYAHRIRAVVTNSQGINLFEFPEQEVAEAVRVKLHQCIADVRKDWE